MNLKTFGNKNMKTLITIKNLIKTLSDKVKSFKAKKVKTRYFIVSYAIRKNDSPCLGSCIVSFNGYVNLDHFRECINEANGQDVNPVVNNIIELSKEDYETFKSQDNGK